MAAVTVFARRLLCPASKASFLAAHKYTVKNTNAFQRTLRTVSGDRSASQPRVDLICEDHNEEERRQIAEFFNRVNSHIEESKSHRHFAIIHLYSRQQLVKEGDIVIIQKYFPAAMGDQIKLEKVLAVGNENVTLIGRPLLNRDLVHVEATVIEKTMTHTYTTFGYGKNIRKFRTWRFKRYPLTFLRINEIKICHKLNESQTVIQ